LYLNLIQRVLLTWHANRTTWVRVSIFQTLRNSSFQIAAASGVSFDVHNVLAIGFPDPMSAIPGLAQSKQRVEKVWT
jgi:hypothetical protein